jgi:hypothetical protein
MNQSCTKRLFADGRAVGKPKAADWRAKPHYGQCLAVVPALLAIGMIAVGVAVAYAIRLLAHRRAARVPAHGSASAGTPA